MYISNIFTNNIDKRIEARYRIVKFLTEYKGKTKIVLPYRTEELDEILFNNYGTQKTFAINFELLKKIDFSNVNMDQVVITGLDFSGCFGVKINPQKVPFNTKFYNDHQQGCLHEHDLTDCNFKGVEFTGPFDNCCVENSSFKGSVGAKINPQKLIGSFYWKRTDLGMKTFNAPILISGCNFCDVEFTEPFIKNNNYDIIFDKCSFKGSKGAKIDPQSAFFRLLTDCNFCDVEFIGSFKNTVIRGSKFQGSKNAEINFQELAKDLGETNRITVRNCDFHDTSLSGDWGILNGVDKKMAEYLFSQSDGKTLRKRRASRYIK